jgi:hypothetical protein
MGATVGRPCRNAVAKVEVGGVEIVGIDDLAEEAGVEGFMAPGAVFGTERVGWPTPR